MFSILILFFEIFVLELIPCNELASFLLLMSFFFILSEMFLFLVIQLLFLFIVIRLCNKWIIVLVFFSRFVMLFMFFIFFVFEICFLKSLRLNKRDRLRNWQRNWIDDQDWLLLCFLKFLNRSWGHRHWKWLNNIFWFNTLLILLHRLIQRLLIFYNLINELGQITKSNGLFNLIRSSDNRLAIRFDLIFLIASIFIIYLNWRSRYLSVRSNDFL